MNSYLPKNVHLRETEEVRQPDSLPRLSCFFGQEQNGLLMPWFTSRLP